MFPPEPTSRPATRMGGARRFERPAAAPPARPDAGPTTARRTWRELVRHAVDLTVAFVLLEDADPRPPGHATPEHRSPHASVDVRHPHRMPLRPMPRPRRPGAVPPRAAACTTPVAPAPAPPKRRTRTP